MKRGGVRWAQLAPFRSSQPARQAWLPAAFLAVCATAALVAYRWTVGPGGLAVFWLNNGLVAAALLLLPANRGLAVAILGFCIDLLCARFMGGSSWGQAALIAGLDFSEAWVAATLIRNVGGARLDLTQVRRFAAVILGGVLPATLLAGTVGSLLFRALYGVDLGSTWLNWAVGDFLGMSIGAPSALIIARFRRFDRPKASSPYPRAALMLALPALAYVLFHSSAPFAFLILPLVLIAAFQLTPPCGALAVVLVAIVAAANTISGHGEFAASRVGASSSILLLQLFLTCVVFSVFLAQGALAERARTHARLVGVLARARRARSRAEAALHEQAATEARFRLLADNAIDVIARFSLDGRPIYFSPSVRDVYGYEPDELIRLLPGNIELVHRDDAPEFYRRLGALLRDGAAVRNERIEFRVVTRSGEIKWMEASFRAVVHPETGKALEMQSIERDVTGRKALEAELEARRVEAEAASVAKSQFLANMSHEIRTPLNGVIAMADLLTRSKLGERERRIAEIIRSSGDSLNRLLSDILDLARIESGRVELECVPFHFGDAVRSAVALCSLHAQEKGVLLAVEVAPDADQRFIGDEVRVRQIVTNLVSNAVKFTGEGAGEGEVRVHVSAPPSVGVRIEVTDTGVGFDPALKERLFDRFQQADGSITRRFGGTGLGLPISRQLAEAMGGLLQCDSTPGEGARFWFEAPLQPAQGPVQCGPPEADPQTPGIGRVLVVDDHPTNRTVAELILRDFGFEVESAENGLQAVAAFERGGVDLILMDMQMPVMDGLTAVRRIRDLEAQRNLARLPILMLSANALAEHAEQSEKAGADGHVAKPITAGALMSAIAAIAESDSDSASAVSEDSLAAGG